MKEINIDEKHFIVEGRNPVLEVLRSSRTIEKILIAKDTHGTSILEIQKKAKEKGIVVQIVDKRSIERMSTGGVTQGVIALTTPYEYKTIEDVLGVAKNKGELPFIVVLDSITDPHNVGAIIRTAECAGAHGVIIPNRRASGITSTVFKASAGALEHIPVVRVTNISTAIDALKNESIWIIGADPKGKKLTQHDYNIPLALVIGSEDKGISRLVKDKCDFLSGIELKGKVSSLNASVAAAVMMFEVVRQRNSLK